MLVLAFYEIHWARKIICKTFIFPEETKSKNFYIVSQGNLLFHLLLNWYIAAKSIQFPQEISYFKIDFFISLGNMSEMLLLIKENPLPGEIYA